MEMKENIWKKMNKMTRGAIRSCLSQDLKYDLMRDFSEEDSRDSREQILDKESREPLAFEEETLPFPVEKGSFYQ